MSRRSILVIGAICWTGAAADAIYHLAIGDVLVPAAMGTAFALWVMLRRRHVVRLAAEAVRS